jgi:hypothetical protein
MNDDGAVHVVSEHVSGLRPSVTRQTGAARPDLRQRGKRSMEEDALDLFTSESRLSTWKNGPLWIKSVAAIVLLTASLGWASSALRGAGRSDARGTAVREEAGRLLRILPGLTTKADVQPTEAAVPSGRLTVDTDPAGAEVRVDGRTVGHSPLSISVPTGAHRLSVHIQAIERVLPLTVSAGEVIHEHMDFSFIPSPEPVEQDVRQPPRVVAPVRPADEAGWVRVLSPFEVDVMEGGELLGTSRMPRMRLTAGRHQLHLVNPQLGFEMMQSVVVAAGLGSDLAIAAPKGALNVNADPWADVWLDGESIGQTPIADLRVPIGPHTLVFRHPELGERSQAIVVRVQEAVRIGVDLR